MSTRLQRNEQKTGGKNGAGSLLIGILIGLVLGLGHCARCGVVHQQDANPISQTSAGRLPKRPQKSPPDLAKAKIKSGKGSDGKPRFDFLQDPARHFLQSSEMGHSRAQILRRYL